MKKHTCIKFIGLLATAATGLTLASCGGGGGGGGESGTPSAPTETETTIPTSPTLAPDAMKGGLLTIKHNGSLEFYYSLNNGSVNVTHFYSSTFYQPLTPAGTYNYTKTSDTTGTLTANHKIITNLDEVNKKYTTAQTSRNYKLTFTHFSSGYRKGTAYCSTDGQTYDFEWKYSSASDAE